MRTIPEVFNGKVVSQREVAWRCIHVLSEAFIERDAAIRVSRPGSLRSFSSICAAAPLPAEAHD
jgi:hypothetical protein